MESYKNEYSNNDITVTYEPCVCIHAEKCANGLSDVFRTSVIPWINLEGSETERIINQIKRCPSGALQFHLKKEVA
ncbi:(4Fe-4S)-binding protein [Gelatiniphilus marinus]|uniref:(4Fe-4S)-binding protein n=1 Tax=Gelatiniphilus marinus TaxID=1759464 RepID=A0ABW5JTI6_9FLAO